MREMSKRDALAAEREVTVMQKVAHPNIIGYYDSFVSQENMHIVMEYADGGTLYTVLRSALHTGPLAESSVLAYFAQLLAAVRCLHQNHILHRDLKSPNVFLTLDNTVKLGDFGLSTSRSFALDPAEAVFFRDHVNVDPVTVVLSAVHAVVHRYAPEPRDWSKPLRAFAAGAPSALDAAPAEVRAYLSVRGQVVLTLRDFNARWRSDASTA